MGVVRVGTDGRYGSGERVTHQNPVTGRHPEPCNELRHYPYTDHGVGGTGGPTEPQPRDVGTSVPERLSPDRENGRETPVRTCLSGPGNLKSAEPESPTRSEAPRRTGLRGTSRVVPDGEDLAGGVGGDDGGRTTTSVLQHRRGNADTGTPFSDGERRTVPDRVSSTSHL